MSCVHGSFLAVDQPAEPEVDDRHEVLHRAEQRERHSRGGVGEQDQRNRRRQAGQRHEHELRRVGRRGDAARLAGAHRHHDHGRDDEGERLGGEALYAGERHASLAQTVEAPRDGDDDRGDRWTSVGDGEDHDRHDGQARGDPLETRHPLAEHQDAECHRAERRHEVAERRLQHVVVHDGVEVGAPVAGEQQRGDDGAPEQAPVAEDRAHRAPAMRDREHERHHHRRTGDAPADQFEGVELVEVLPEDDQQTPDEVGGQPDPDAHGRLVGVTAGFGHGRTR